MAVVIGEVSVQEAEAVGAVWALECFESEEGGISVSYPFCTASIPVPHTDASDLARASQDDQMFMSNTQSAIVCELVVPTPLKPAVQMRLSTVDACGNENDDAASSQSATMRCDVSWDELSLLATDALFEHDDDV